MRRSAKEVAIDQGQVRLHAGFQNSQPVFGEGRVGRAGGEAAERLLEGERLIGVPAARGLTLGVSCG